MSNPKKGHTPNKGIEYHIQLLAQAWVDYTKLMKFVHSDFDSIDELVQLQNQLNFSISFLSPFHCEEAHKFDGLGLELGFGLPAEYLEKKYKYGLYTGIFSAQEILCIVFEGVADLEWLIGSENCLPIDEDVDVYMPEIPMGLRKNHILENSSPSESEIEEIYTRAMSVLKKEVPYMYSEDGEDKMKC